VKELLNSIQNCKSYPKRKSGALFNDSQCNSMIYTIIDKSTKMCQLQTQTSSWNKMSITPSSIYKCAASWHITHIRQYNHRNTMNIVCFINQMIQTPHTQSILYASIHWATSKMVFNYIWSKMLRSGASIPIYRWQQMRQGQLPSLTNFNIQKSIW